MGPDKVPLAQWKAMGDEEHSLVADPMFVDPERDDYGLKPDSPALKLGFQPIERHTNRAQKALENGKAMPDTRTFIPPAEAKRPFFAGIDLGGTSIKVGVVDDLGRSLSWLSIPTQVERGAENAAQRMGDAVHEAVRRAGLTPANSLAWGSARRARWTFPRNAVEADQSQGLE